MPEPYLPEEIGFLKVDMEQRLAKLPLKNMSVETP